MTLKMYGDSDGSSCCVFGCIDMEPRGKFVPASLGDLV